MTTRRQTTKTEQAIAWLTLSLILLLLPACAAWESTSETETVSAPAQQQETDQNRNDQHIAAHDVIEVEVIVESDSDSASHFKAEINARKNPQSASYDTIDLPYRQTFEVSKNAFIPLPSVRLQADAAENADWISCTILYDGEEVATHLSRGNAAQAVCEKNFHLGPG
ncbi:hypothetical protein [Saccharibacillus sacchari]|uniref:Uncharacterized protein n=1 Tax=Saccharibacillus sacchari TaxID=456493 RepID=A0ACC6PHE7_9BACL